MRRIVSPADTFFQPCRTSWSASADFPLPGGPTSKSLGITWEGTEPSTTKTTKRFQQIPRVVLAGDYAHTAIAAFSGPINLVEKGASLTDLHKRTFELSLGLKSELRPQAPKEFLAHRGR